MVILTSLIKTYSKVLFLLHWAQQQFLRYTMKDKYFGYTSDEFIKKFAEAQWGDLDERIAKGSLTQTGVRSYLRHIPIRGVNEGWPKEMYILTDSCVRKLYEYSQKQGFISENCTLSEFLAKHGIYVGIYKKR